MSFADGGKAITTLTLGFLYLVGIWSSERNLGLVEVNPA